MTQGIAIKGTFQGQAIMTALLAMNNNLARINTNLRIQNTLTRKLAGGHKRAATATKGHANSMKGLALRFVGYNLAMNVAMGAQQKLIQLISDSVVKYREFETRLAEISTILQEDVNQMSRFKSGIESLSTTYGQSTSDISKGLYDIMSAAFSSRDAMNLLNTSIKASIAGLSDVRTSVKIFTTVLNSYGKSAEQATHVSDVLFQSVVRGKFQFEDLEQALGYVVPIAAQAGISFDELSAALSTATRHGLHIDMTARGLALALQGIVNPSEKARKAARAYGVEMNGLSLRVLGLKGWFDQLGEAMDKHGKSILGELVPNMRSLRVAMVLAGEEGALGFAEDLQYLENVTGRTEEALQEMMDTSAIAAAKLEQQMEIRLRAIGDSWDEVVLNIKEFGIAVADNWQYAIPLLGQVLRVFDDIKEASQFTKIEAIIKKFPETDEAIEQVEQYIAAIKEQEELSIKMATMDVQSQEYRNVYEELKLYDAIIAGTVETYNEYVGAVKDTQDALGQLEINLSEVELEIIRLDKALNDSVTVGWGSYQKTLEGTLGLELAQLEMAQKLKDSQHDVKMGLIDSTYEWKTNNSALEEAVTVVREHEKAQKDDAQATKRMTIAMRLLQIEMLEIQLSGMMRRRGLTRNEEKKMKALQIEQAKLRLENMKATKDETVIMHDNYELKKQFIKEFLATLGEESYQLKYKYDYDIIELNKFIDEEKIALETRKEWWELTNSDIFNTCAKLISDIDALSSPVKAFMKESGTDVEEMLKSAIQRKEEIGEQRGTYIPIKEETPISNEEPTEPRKNIPDNEHIVVPLLNKIVRVERDPDWRIGKPLLHKYTSSSGKSILDAPGSHWYGDIVNFKRGIEHVPHDMPAIVHRGEQIIPAGKDVSGDNINVNISVTANVNTDYDVERLAAKLGASMQTQLASKTGKSKYRMR